MSEATIACTYGCTIKGSHRSECNSLCRHQNRGHTCPKKCDGQCTGCLPRPADTGAALCHWCVHVLTQAVEEVPALAEHLRWLGNPHDQPLAKPPSDDTIARTDPAEGTILPGPWLALDELNSLLASWAHLIIDEHPNQPMRGPNAPPWHGDIANWLLPLLPWCTRQSDWAAIMREEIPAEVATIRARYPTIDDTEGAKRIAMPCPACDLLTLTYTPPRWERQPFVVSCDNPDCARIYSEDDFEWFKHMALTGQTIA